MAAKIRRDDEVIVLIEVKIKVNAVKLRMSCLPARSLLKVSTWLRNIRSRFRP